MSRIACAIIFVIIYTPCRWIGYASRVIDSATMEQNDFAKGRRPGHDGMAALELQRKK